MKWGDQIHYKDSTLSEHYIEYEYDENGNYTHIKYSFGYERWYEYDSNGNVIHTKDSNGYEDWWDYDDKGKLIYFKNSEGYEERNEE